MKGSGLDIAQRTAGGIPLRRSGAVQPVRLDHCPPVLHFGNPGAEYRAAKRGAVVFDVGDRTQIEIRGQDRQRFLHNFCTNDIKGLKNGAGCEAFVVTVKGRVVAHIFVFAEPDALWVEAHPGAEETLLAHWNRYLINEDVQLSGRTAELGELLLSGPQSAAVLSTLDVDPPFAGSCELLDRRTVRLGEGHVAIRRVDMLGQTGFLLSTARSELTKLWSTLIAAGARPAGAQTFHALRIEAGFPWCGIDLSEENLAPEADRNKQAISFSKGCYLGQEPIARIDAHGHVNRMLRGLRLDSGLVPEQGTQLVTDEGRAAGVVTSAALIPDENRAVAVAMMSSSCREPGTMVRVRTDGGEEAASVFWHGQPAAV